VVTVNDDPVVVERRLAAGGLACPACAAVLTGWGWARPRTILDGSRRLVVRPRRTRCGGCATTHVLLPAALLLRRADTVAVIGAALTAKAAGYGARPIAAATGRPLGTVKGWLRRASGRAEALRIWFTRVLVAVAADPVVPEPAGSMFADAVAAMTAAALSVADRFAIPVVTPWPIVSAVSQGRLLSPDWPVESINTSSPWLAVM
jgi:hypothetical protein